MFTRVFKTLRKNDELGVSLRRKTLGFSQVEGGLYALMVGCSETFVLYYAAKRGLSQFDFALISTIPILLGAAANWLIPQFVKSKFLKPALLATVLIQICGLLGLFYSINIQNYFLWILFSLSLYWIGGMAASPLWIDWMSGWLPHDRMSRYLSRRNGFVALMTVIAYLLAAYWMNADGTFHSYQLVFGIALLCRTASFSFLLLQPHPVQTMAPHENPLGIAKILNSKPIWIMILFSVLFRFVANIASPFFLPYMVNELRFSLMDYAWISAVPFLARAVFLAQWGEAIRSYRPFIGLQIAMFISSVICLVWTFTSNFLWLTIIEGFSGIAWGGFELSCVVILYGFAPRNARGIIGFHMALQHSAALIGALIGSHLLSSGWSSFDVFRLSSLLRFLVVAGFFFIGLQLPEVRVKLRNYGDFLMTAMSVRLKNRI